MSDKNTSVKTNVGKDSPGDIRHSENSYRPPRPNPDTAKPKK